VHDDRILVEKRIERELWQRVLPALHPRSMPLSVEAWHAPGEPVSWHEASRQTFQPFAIGAQWSRPWGTTWFKLGGIVPDDWHVARAELVIDLGFRPIGAGFQAEGLVWLDGEPLQGVHPRRTAVPMPELTPGPFSVFVEAASNPSMPAAFRPTSMGSLGTAGDRPLYRLARADLAERNDDVYELLLDVEVLYDVMLALAVDDPRRARLLRALASAFDVLDMADVPRTAAAARARLAPALALPARHSSMRVVGVGHAHIDSAWLWPIRETVRKCARTFASAVRLMDDRPDYTFVCSQAAQYDWMRQQYPQLFERMRTKVASRQFVPVGGMWVEADMNLPSGESLVRQLVHGQRWFDEHLGLRCREVWIPDVFGYPASLPQIFAAGGCDRFITQKLSWNKQNRFPHNTFWWEGLDGTRVLTHFPPVDTYNAEVTGREMVFSEQNFQDHGWSDWALMPYGYGNGGGGPTREMVDRAARMRDLDGSPRLTLGTSDEFFEHVESEVVADAPVPVWRGELYFEMHRGTLTSQMRTKLGNRTCERLLREAELWWAIGGDLPADVATELDSLWKDVLLQQFHDILPGSSIAWVHADAEAAHHRVAAALEQSIAAAFDRLALAGPTVANAGARPRFEVATFSGTPPRDGAVQQLGTGQWACLVAAVGSGLSPLAALATSDRIVTTEHTMANGRLCVQWDLDGTIVSIIDVHRGRELLPTGRAITIELAPDHPVEYDAWDLEAWTRALGSPIAATAESTVEFVERGPLLCSVRVVRPFGRSRVELTYTLRAESARLDIGVDVDWREDEQLLSLMVPLDVRADEATCDIQFGNVRRPMHASSPWDAAKFEVCAHRFVDVAEPSFGVAVLNDGRYGHCLFDGGVRVSLLRAAKYPDPDADHGRHRVTISVLPHGSGLYDVLAEAESLNVPLRLTGPLVADGAFVDERPPLVTIDHPGVELSSVKRADDGDGDLIVRLYEACGDRAPVAVRVNGRVLAASRCNALEEPQAGIDVADGFVALTLRPFELVTLRLTHTPTSFA
jgi:alpha-mannosidase